MVEHLLICKRLLWIRFPSTTEKEERIGEVEL